MRWAYLALVALALIGCGSKEVSQSDREKALAPTSEEETRKAYEEAGMKDEYDKIKAQDKAYEGR